MLSIHLKFSTSILPGETRFIDTGERYSTWQDAARGALCENRLYSWDKGLKVEVRDAS